MKKIVLLLFLLPLAGFAQSDSARYIPLRFTLFNNGTFLPGGGKAAVFSVPVHPGIEIAAEHAWHTGDKSQLFQTAVLGYYYHKFSQHGIRLYTELGWRYKGECRLGFEVRLGAGYLHAIPDVQIFTLNDDGEYVKAAKFGRPEFILPSVALALNYDLKKDDPLSPKIQFAYQLWMMMPFVKNYVPVLPNSALHLGIIVPFKR